MVLNKTRNIVLQSNGTRKNEMKKKRMNIRAPNNEGSKDSIKVIEGDNERIKLMTNESSA